jgi:hypothetical protein
MTDDTDLHERFAALRREDAVRTPPFSRLINRRQGRAVARAGNVEHTREVTRARASPYRLSPGAAFRAFAACFTVAALVFVYRTPRPRAPAAPGAAPWLADWRAPTDFLLDTPGRALLRSVPTIGRPYAPLDPQRIDDTAAPRRNTREAS